MQNPLIDQAAEKHREALAHIRSVKDLRDGGARDDDVARVANVQFQLALECETEALDLLTGLATEPLKSDVCSTAALAPLALERWDDADRFAREGLAQKAPDRTVGELNALIAAARERRRLF